MCNYLGRQLLLVIRTKCMLIITKMASFLEISDIETEVSSVPNLPMNLSQRLDQTNLEGGKQQKPGAILVNPSCGLHKFDGVCKQYILRYCPVLTRSTSILRYRYAVSISTLSTIDSRYRIETYRLIVYHTGYFCQAMSTC